MHGVWAIQNGYWIHNRVLSSSNFSFSPTQVRKLKRGPHTLKAKECLCSRLVPTLPLRSSETDWNMTQIFSIHSRSRYTIYTINRTKTLAVGFGRLMHHDVPVIWSAPHPGSVANCINAVLWNYRAARHWRGEKKEDGNLKERPVKFRPFIKSTPLPLSTPIIS
jgi:hypothetical protein